ncbi:MAG: hypothetical protein RLZZ59_907 [Pseudomonadota bacterium]|jgi:flavin reductase (DIM6/NTAB) family NADH-FMN oxidoreductase RutF
MFFDLNNNDQPKGLFKACVIPRPIAWISTISREKITNLAPFSYFQAIADIPPTIMFAASAKDGDMTPKDTVANIEATGEFVVNFTNTKSAEFMMLSSANLAYNESEIDKFNIPIKSSKLVSVPSVSISPINLECIHVKTIDIPGTTGGNKMVIGRVIGISVDEDILDEDKKLDPTKLDPLYRLGYNQYSTLNKILEITKTK